MVVEKPELKKYSEELSIKKNRGPGNAIHDCEVSYTCFQQSKEGPGRWKLTKCTRQGQMRSGRRVTYDSAEYSTQQLQFYFPLCENQCHKVWAVSVVVVKLNP